MTRFNRLTCLATIWLTLMCAAPAIAWNNHGHMLVAYLAYQQLNTAQKAKVDALISLNPLFPQWKTAVATLPAAKRSAAIFAIAATWPDIIKTDDALPPDERHHDDGSAGGNRPPPGPSAFENTGYADLARHKYWHFIDTPFSTDGTPLPPVPVPNVVERIGVLRATLASNAAGMEKLKSYDLVWLLHLVGDIHQPLHAATRVSKALPNGDDGGNLVKLCASCRDELHGFWDSVLGTGDTPSAIVSAASAMHVATGPQTTVLDPQKWADEGFAIAKSDVYHTPIGNGAGPFTLTDTYKQNAKKIAGERVALAAARLANILKADIK
jgi:hypothetical protein